MTTKTNTDHEIRAQGWINEAQRNVDALCNDLAKLVEDLQAYAKMLPGDPSSTAADIVCLYLSRVGNGSVWLGHIVSNAGKAEAHLAQIQHSAPKSGGQA